MNRYSLNAEIDFSFGNFQLDSTTNCQENTNNSDEYNASALGHPFAGRDSYQLLNVSLYLAGWEERWKLQVLGKNLTDELVISGMLEAAGSGAGRQYADLVGYGNFPRTVALQLSYSFR